LSGGCWANAVVPKVSARRATASFSAAFNLFMTFLLRSLRLFDFNAAHEKKCIPRTKRNFMNSMEFRRTRVPERPGNPEIKRETGKRRSVGYICCSTIAEDQSYCGAKVKQHVKIQSSATQMAAPDFVANES
jgi:hypothetical protein